MRGVYGHGGKKITKRVARIKKKSGGGQLVDQGIHLIDLARLFFGDLKVYSFILIIFIGIQMLKITFF